MYSIEENKVVFFWEFWPYVFDLRYCGDDREHIEEVYNGR
jgi:hypothetical protein